ncbi:hypothetical protein PR048_022121 [Dryococelus australis]|uniref:Uncharacterized protein n=1 Tax=Dryococelus australis TaxID=614101 RepID=A0ABQ9H040_9NEOP|nr:hypothetical protein PR048_022121 [Dryococelus australis]
MGTRPPGSILVTDRFSTTKISLPLKLIRKNKLVGQPLTFPQHTNSTIHNVTKPSTPVRDLTPCEKDLEDADPSGYFSVKTSNHVSPKYIWPIPQPKRKLTNKGPNKEDIGSAKKCSKGDEHTSVKQDKRKNMLKKIIKRKLILPAEESDEELNIDSEESLPEIEIGVPRPDNDDAVCIFPAEESDEEFNIDSEESLPEIEIGVPRPDNDDAVCIFPAEESDEELNIDSEESLPEIEIGFPRPGNDDAVCIFCDGVFSGDRGCELWVQCMNCGYNL